MMLLPELVRPEEVEPQEVLPMDLDTTLEVYAGSATADALAELHSLLDSEPEPLIAAAGSEASTAEPETCPESEGSGASIAQLPVIDVEDETQERNIDK
jgi:hypothetical protein